MSYAEDEFNARKLVRQFSDEKESGWFQLPWLTSVNFFHWVKEVLKPAKKKATAKK
ncbi:MAG: hypothetical protein Q4F92_09310 [Acidaminococcus sp.]|uniref:hypothetical protein n=1 Tax=Acidaminococcus sp. TaxID=1872103 RepID=UPI0026E039B9|nr:hypothetical protein [Acidaminococcus sp.]MDO5598514.1 hypothetical protein [Acidaminococcus sp.]